MHAHHHQGCRGEGHHHHGPFGPGKFPFGAMAGHMHGFGGPGGGRARRGGIRAAILRLLAEEPMHGYQIIQELGKRSGGAWSPSAGSIYPALQLLADEGLVSAEETSGKRVFSLTDAGRAAVAETAGQDAPWEEAAQGDTGVRGLREAGARLMHSAVQVGRAGSPEQVAEAIEIMNDARKKLYAILAED